MTSVWTLHSANDVRHPNLLTDNSFDIHILRTDRLFTQAPSAQNVSFRMYGI